MDLSKLIQHVEELIYQVVVLLVLIPKTLRRVVSDVDWFEVTSALNRLSRVAIVQPPSLSCH